MVKRNMGPAERRNEFIKVAEELFNEKGYENTSVDDIVARMNVAKGLFYYYFDSKDKLLEIILNRLIDEIGSSIIAVMEKKGLTAMEKYRELISVNVEIGSRAKILITFFKQERNQALHYSLERRAMELMVPAVERIIIQGVEEGVFETLYPKETAIAIQSVTRVLLNEMPSDPSIEEISHLLVVMQYMVERLLGAKPGTFTVFMDSVPAELRPILECRGSMLKVK